MYDINWPAVLAAAIAGFALGAIWYSPIGFLHLWIRAAQIQKPPTPAPQLFVVLFVLQFVTAAGFAIFVGPQPTVALACRQATIISVCFVATSLAINYQGANRRWLHWLIDAGYHVVRFLAFALILGLWH